MPEQQRRAILLREWQGLSYREIAEELEVTQSAVETLIFRARRSLAAGLEQPDSVKTPKRKSFRRALHAFDIGTIAAAFKALLAGSAAVKATAAAVAVTAAATTAYGVEKRSSRSHRSGQPRRRRRWSASPPPPFRRQRGSPRLPARLGSPRLPHRSVRPSRPCRSRGRQVDCGCVGRDALGAAALHPGRSHARPGCAGRAGPGGAEPDRRLRLQLPRPSRRSSRAQTQGKKDNGKRTSSRCRRWIGPVVVPTADARSRDRRRRPSPSPVRAHGDDLPDARARGRHESGTGSCHDRGSGRADSGRHDVEHDEGSARARPRHELGERGEQIDRDAVGVLQLGVPLSPERVPRLLLAVEPRRRDARVDLVHLGRALALERE